MLEVKGLKAGYDGVPAVHEVSLLVAEGEVVSIVGANGAGKTTLLRAIAGVVRPMAGEVIFMGKRLNGEPPHRIVSLGIAHVPEGRRLFGSLTVYENLQMGAFPVRREEEIKKTLAWVYELFPVLAERSKQRSDTLSGGEQQMLAIARGLMSSPRLLMLDEPSLGIMPKFVAKIMETIRRIAAQGTAILLVEQNVEKALRLADRAYVLQNGRIVLSGTGEELLGSTLIRESYLGTVSH